MDVKCPKCGSETRLRTSKKDGSKFHVCVNYPECKGKVAFDDDWDDDWDEERPAIKTTHDKTQQQINPTTEQIPAHSQIQPKAVSPNTIGCLVPIIMTIIIVVAGFIVWKVGLLDEWLPSSPHTSTGQETTLGESRSNLVPFGQPIQYKDRELTVLNSWEESSYGEYKWIYVTVRVRFLQSSSKTDSISSESDFRVVGTIGKVSSNLGAAPDNGLVFGEYFGGSIVEGNIRTMVDINDSDFNLVWSCDIGKSLYFALNTN